MTRAHRGPLKGRRRQALQLAEGEVLEEEGHRLVEEEEHRLVEEEARLVEEVPGLQEGEERQHLVN